MKIQATLITIPSLLLVLTVPAQASWVQRSGCATSIASAADETWIVGCGPEADRPFYKWNPSTLTFNQVSAAPFGAQKITVSLGGVPWILRSNGSIWKWTGSQFSQPNGIGVYQGGPSCATAITVGFNDDAWIVTCNGAADAPIFRWNGSAWVQPSQGGIAKNVGMFLEPTYGGGVQAIPWATQNLGSIYEWALWGWMPEGSNGGSITDHAVIALNKVYVWDDSTQTWPVQLSTGIEGKTLKEVAGSGGKWVIATDGSIWQRI